MAYHDVMSEAQEKFLSRLLAEKDVSHLNDQLAGLWQTYAAGTALNKGDTSKLIDGLVACPKAVLVAAGSLQGLTSQPAQPAFQGPWYKDKTGLLWTLPDSKYALLNEDGHPLYYEIRAWHGSRYFRRLVGAPGNWSRKWVPEGQAKAALAEIAQDYHAAAKLYVQTFTRCCRCDSPLSVASSIEAGIGPVCAKKMGW